MLRAISFILHLQAKRTNWIQTVMTRAQVAIFPTFMFMGNILHLSMALELPSATG
jgi:hypothetical protein